MDSLIKFLKEYTEFFEQLEEKQQEKLDCLASKELKQIEETIVMQQAADKQLENMEKRRRELMESLGLAGCTFKDLMERTEGEERKTLVNLYGRLAEAVDNVKFINQKAVKMAQTELLRMGVKTSGLTGESGVYKPGPASRRNIFEKKI